MFHCGLYSPPACSSVLVSDGLESSKCSKVCDGCWRGQSQGTAQRDMGHKASGAGLGLIAQRTGL